MTGRERTLAVLQGQRTDRLAAMPITMMFAADVLGVKYSAYAQDFRVLADAQVKTAEMFGFDYVSAISDPAREAADLGARIQWYDDQPPAIIEAEALLADKTALGRVEARDPVPGGRMEDRLRAIELLRQRVGGELLVEGWVEGPCAEGADLRGINRLMTDFTDDPEFVHALFEFNTARAARFAELQIEVGADIIGVGDAAASLVGPRIYKEFVWPWEKKLVEAIHARGGRVRLHICGNTRRILEGMGALGCSMVDIDYPVAMDQARAAMGEQQTLAGNLNPVKDVRDGTPDSIAQALEKLLAQAGPRWIVAAGCEIVRDTPHQNVDALVKFAQTHPASAAA
ncbi:MAG: uroporphyrinogen decarboxylase family protein [Terracidiphilus sp.]|jgi:MtaA/CmuA family methyltransferase